MLMQDRTPRRRDAIDGWTELNRKAITNGDAYGTTKSLFVLRQEMQLIAKKGFIRIT